MKKGTKLASLLVAVALMVPACNNNGGGQSKSNVPSSSSQPAATYTVSITNKEALQADWFIGDQSRKVEISTDPQSNITQLVNEGTITITSSDPAKLGITGQMANPVAAGEVTITVACGESTDTVVVTIGEQQTTKQKFGVNHEGTAEDPFDNEDAIKVAKSDKYNNEEFYVRGEVASYYHTPGERTNGEASWFLKPAQPGGEQFEIYKCKKEGTGTAAYITDDDVWPGGITTAKGKFTWYNQQQCETTSAILVSCTGTKPAPRAVVSKTFAEVMTIGQALVDGDSYWDYLKFEGYVSSKAGNNYFLTAEKAQQVATDGSNSIELYFYQQASAEIAAKLKQDAKVEVTMVIKNYHGVIENVFALKNEDITVKEEGVEWAIPEPEVATKTVTEFVALEDDGKKAKAYSVTGTIKTWKNATSDKDKFGNMVLTDGTTDLIIYGATATATALAWDNSSAYAWTSPNDFLTNTVTQALALNNTITMKLVRNDYKSGNNVTIEGVGIVTNVVAVATESISLPETAEVEAGAKTTLTATRLPEASNTPCEWLSSDETVATVDGGVVTGVAAGTAVITARISDEIKAQCTVTVKPVAVSSLSKATSIAIGDSVYLAAETNDGVKKQFDGTFPASGTKFGNAVDYNAAPTENVGKITVAAGNKENTFALKVGDKFLKWSSGNSLDLEDTLSDNSSWTVTFANGKATITNYVKDGTSDRIIKYNASAPRFACYKSGQTDVSLWK